jgi:hypothetical protein
MIKVWFLMVLMSYPNMPAIAYKGYGGFFEKQECEDNRALVENMVADYEMQRGNTVYIESYCMEMEAFTSGLDKKKKLNKIGTDA